MSPLLKLFGRDAAEFTAGHEKALTPAPEGSPWWRLLERSGKILFIGTGISCNTFLHGVDEWLKEAAERNIPLEEKDPAESSSPMLLTAPGGKPFNEAKEKTAEKDVPTLASEAKKILQKREELESAAKEDGGVKFGP